jgi:hypothetical protein
MTNGIVSSLWRVKLEKYQGPLVTEPKNLDWSLSIIFLLDGFIQPHCIVLLEKKHETKEELWRRCFLCGPPRGYTSRTEKELPFVISSRDCE